ncbi:MAG: DUF362 domain-containing protein [Bryobacteraceae bacterium]
MKTASAVSGGILLGSRAIAADRITTATVATATVATATVAIARCRTYGPELLPALQTMFDELGGLERFVKGKTVAVKINLTGSPTYRMGYLPLGDTHYTNPHVIGATAYLMGRAGAKRIRLLECPWATADPIEEYVYRANWNPQDILSAAPMVEFENTNYLGNAKKYSRLRVPDGGRMFPAFDLNHSYQDCDTFVSLAKLKEHATAGITLSMKNLFGITPATIYGSGAGVDEPSILPAGGRDMIHRGYRQPSKSAPGELNPSSPREGGYRVPRTVVDLVAARPIDLAIVEGVKTMAGGEGPWIMGASPVAPGVIVAGTNPVATDAVCMAVMGFDPMADRGTPPFEMCDSTLRLAADAGLGPRDLRQIEVVGTSIQEARFDFSVLRQRRRKLFKDDI